MSELQCPQCKIEINNTTNRLFQDECGHKKCRTCVMQDDFACKMCQETQNFIKNQVSNVSVIKYDGNIKPNSDLSVEEEVQPKSKVKSKNNCDKKVKRSYKSLVIPNHVIIVTSSPQLYKCTICSKSFQSTSNVKYHTYCSGIEKPFKCKECDKMFITSSSLEIHSRTHSGLKPFSCSYCDKRFSERGKLNRHSKLHTGNFDYVCSECGKKFPTNDGLKSHLRLHSGEKPFKCPHCDNSFRNKSNLNKHLARHAKDKLYMCEQCGKKFRGKHALSVHKKRHTLKKTFKCSYCEKGFLSNKELKRHTIIHKDLKIYNCTMCSTKFRRKDNLDRHLRNIHSNLNSNEKSKTKQRKETLDTSKSEKEITKTVLTQKKQPENDQIDEGYSKEFKEKPNAINVIKVSTNKLAKDSYENSKNAVPVINGPFKLAFKNGTFKHNYNIHNREYPDMSHSKNFDTAKSLDIFHKILPPPIKPKTQNDEIDSISKNRNVITSVGKVNEKDSLEICKRIFGSVDTIHYETSFENKTHASIKNIKFKLPSTYTDNALKFSENYSQSSEIFNVVQEGFSQNPAQKVNASFDIDFCHQSVEYTELKTATFGSVNGLDGYENDKNLEYQSVIVNPQNLDTDLNKTGCAPPFNEIHWRKRKSQFTNSKK